MLPHPIRWANRSDLPDILRIDRQSFRQPLTERDLLGLLECQNCIGLISEIPDPLIDGGRESVAYAIYRISRTRMEVLHLAVDPRYRLRGIGKTLMLHLLSKLRPNRRNELVIDTCETNRPSLEFLKSFFVGHAQLIRSGDESPDDVRFRFFCGSPVRPEDAAWATQVFH